MTTDTLTCVDEYDGECRGTIEVRSSPYSPTGFRAARCDEHFGRVLNAHEATSRRYPDQPNPPSWFDPADAGESWDEPW